MVVLKLVDSSLVEKSVEADVISVGFWTVISRFELISVDCLLISLQINWCPSDISCYCYHFNCFCPSGWTDISTFELISVGSLVMSHKTNWCPSDISCYCYFNWFFSSLLVEISSRKESSTNITWPIKWH